VGQDRRGREQDGHRDDGRGCEAAGGAQLHLQESTRGEAYTVLSLILEPASPTFYLLCSQTTSRGSFIRAAQGA
jgi:hypothetical protein